MRRIYLLTAFILAVATAFASPAAADWRQDMKVLRVGFLAGDNPAYQVARMEKFRWRLQYGLAVPVELFPARSYQALIDAEASGRIQYAILSSLAFVALDRNCHCAEPLVQPSAENSARGFRAIIVSRSDGPIASLADAKGMRLAVGPKDSISGRLAPWSGLAAEGIEPDLYFARVIETTDSRAALETLAAGDADLSVAWSTAPDVLSAEAGSGPIAELVNSGTQQPTGLRLLWQSDIIPFGPHAIRSDLPPQAKAALLDTLLNLKTVDPDAYDAVERQLSGGFVQADPKLYSRFSTLLASVATPQ